MTIPYRPRRGKPSLQDRVYDWLTANPHRTFHYSEVERDLGISGRQVISAITHLRNGVSEIPVTTSGHKGWYIYSPVPSWEDVQPAPEVPAPAPVEELSLPLVDGLASVAMRPVAQLTEGRVLLADPDGVLWVASRLAL